MPCGNFRGNILSKNSKSNAIDGNVLRLREIEISAVTNAAVFSDPDAEKFNAGV